MANFPSLQAKVNTLKALVEKDSISPSYLGAILDALIAAIIDIDTTDICADLNDSIGDIDNTLSSISKALPDAGVLSGEMMPPEVYGNLIHIPLRIHRADGSETVHRLELPGATASKAGLYDLATRQAVAQAVADALAAALTADAKAVNAQTSASDALAAAATADSKAQAAGTAADNAQASADTAQATAEAALTAANDASALAESLDNATNAKIGRSSGIAPLDGSGHVPARHLPSYVDDVVEFAARIPSVAAWMALDATEEQAASGEVVFVNVECRFALRVTASQFYRRWPGQEAYGTEATAGICPVKGKIYVDTSTGTPYRWGGSGLAVIAAPTPIGTGEGEAFPGPEGLALSRKLNGHLAGLESVTLTNSVLAGAGVPLAISGTVAEVKYRALAISLPAGRTYEVSTTAKSVPRVDMRVVHPDGSITWLAASLRPGHPFRFTPQKDVAWLGFDCLPDNSASATYDPDYSVSLSLVIKAVDPQAEADEAAARRLDSWAVAHAAANAGAVWTKKTLPVARVAVCLDDLSDIQGPFVDAAMSAYVPLTIAAVPERLGITLSNGKTGLEICRSVAAAGGEIAVHNSGPLTPASTPADWHKYFVTDRLELEKAGLKVGGIIKAGGATADQEAALDRVMMGGYLKAYHTHGIGFNIPDPRYSDWRRSLGAYTMAEFEAELTNAAANKTAIVFYTHCNDILKSGDTHGSHLSKFIDMLGTLNRMAEDGSITLTTLRGCTLDTLQRSDN